jgi:dolichol-phosphate mannosyltransferase
MSHYDSGSKAILDRSGNSQISFGDVRLGIACPMANEGPDAVGFVTQVLEQCHGFRQVLFFAVLDRATTDNTLDLLRAHAQQEPRLVVVWAPEDRSVVDAYFRGYREALAAGSDWILEIDAGFSHRPVDIPRFFTAMQRGYDCVFGSRFMPGGSIRRSSWKRYLISRGGTFLTNLLLGTRLTDMTSGFEMFSRSALEAIVERGIRSRAHFFQTEIKVHCRRLKIIEVPIQYEAASPRLGTSALKDAFGQLWHLFRLRLSGRL